MQLFHLQPLLPVLQCSTPLPKQTNSPLPAHPKASKSSNTDEAHISIFILFPEFHTEPPPSPFHRLCRNFLARCAIPLPSNQYNAEQEKFNSRGNQYV